MAESTWAHNHLTLHPPQPAESAWAWSHLTLHPPQPAESAWAWSHLTLHPPAPVANIFWHTPTGTYRGRLYTRHNGQTISP